MTGGLWLRMDTIALASALETPQDCDEVMKAAALRKSALLGETSAPVPLASLRDRKHYAEGAEPQCQASWGAPGNWYACLLPRDHTGPHKNDVAEWEYAPTGHLPQHTGGHPECTAPGCGQPGHHLHAASIPSGGA